MCTYRYVVCRWGGGFRSSSPAGLFPLLRVRAVTTERTARWRAGWSLVSWKVGHGLHHRVHPRRVGLRPDVHGFVDLASPRLRNGDSCRGPHADGVAESAGAHSTRHTTAVIIILVIFRVCSCAWVSLLSYCHFLILIWMLLFRIFSSVLHVNIIRRRRPNYSSRGRRRGRGCNPFPPGLSCR